MNYLVCDLLSLGLLLLLEQHTFSIVFIKLNQAHHLFRQNYMLQVSNKVCVDSHLDQLRLATQNIYKFYAHRLHVHHCVVRAQVKKYLKTFDIQELLSKVYRSCTVVVI